jgi:hypothetical protein
MGAENETIGVDRFHSGVQVVHVGDVRHATTNTGGDDPG